MPVFLMFLHDRGGNVTDHLEPYRRMARSIRFFPPLSLAGSTQESVAQPVTPVPGADLPSWKTITQSHEKSAQEPPIDPSEHVAALVNEAVRKPTVLPTTYAIQENIGDRINRMAPPKRVEAIINPFKIPQPDPSYNGTSVPTIESKASEAGTSTRVEEARLEASAPALEVAEAPTVEEKPEPQTSEAQTSEGVDDARTEASAPATDAAEAPPVEQMPEPQSSEADAKKQIDDTHKEASASGTVITEAPPVAQMPSDDAGEGVVEPLEVEEANSETSTTVVEPVVAEETSNDEATRAGVAEPIDVEETREDISDNNTPTEVVSEPDALTDTTSDKSSDTEAPIAEAEDAQAPSLLARVSSAVEAAVTAFQQPEADQKDSVAGKEPAPSEPAETDAPAAETVEPLTNNASADAVEDSQKPTLLDRVSSAVEAAVTAFQNPEADQKDSEADEEPEPATTEVSAADAMPLRTDASADEGEDAQTLNVSEPVSSTVEAVAISLKDSDVDTKPSEAAVKPTPATEEKATDTQTDEIACPKCESTNIRKNGRRGSKQRYICKDCGRQFGTEAEDELTNEASSDVETSNVKGSEIEPEFSASSKRPSKKKTKAKGFGSPKAKK